MTTNDTIFVGGEFVPAHSSARIPLVNPATEEEFARVPDADDADVDRAVQAARAALPGWRDLDPADRAATLNRIADAFAARAEEFNDLVMQENGATKAWASFVGGGGHFAYRGAAAELTGFSREETRTSSAGTSLWINEPYGVVGAIVPWNSPQVLIGSKLGPALAAGCTIVLKPSPETTLDGYLLGEVMAEAGVPAGVVNIVAGGRDTGASLVRHTGVDMVSFTGSSAAGRNIASVCGEQLKPVSAELGGKSALVVLEDADLAQLTAMIHTDLVPYSGQVCYANTRVLVHRDRFDEVLDLLCTSFRESPVGDPTDPATVFGPLITPVAREKVEGYLRSGVEEGARAVVGGGRPAGLDRGYYVEPTIFVDVRPEMRIFQEEIFGPVLAVVPFSDDDEAIALANDSAYGLAGSVLGADLDHANAVARRMETGRVMVNLGKGANRFSSLWKTSGLGVVGDLSPHRFLQPKNLMQP